ncbi:LuxR C-terminal-related transcriptional regulator, partial [Micromonospora orduensis]|uniref:LuxR C-terminal-related transcriptional regulator n=1 Tax=Micromonospora orduensis TaxID=1420891 RepID=UPI003F53EA91
EHALIQHVAAYHLIIDLGIDLYKRVIQHFQEFISAKTVEHHVARMRSRLNCANRAELLALLRTLVADRASNTAGQPWPRRSTR